jgi:hypothetical protein
MDETFYRALLQDVNNVTLTEMYGGIVFTPQLLSFTEYSSRLAIAVYTVDFLKGETKASPCSALCRG